MRGGCKAVVVTGGETDVCVLAAVLSAIDLGFDVIVLATAVQLDLIKTEDFLSAVTNYGTYSQPGLYSFRTWARGYALRDLPASNSVLRMRPCRSKHLLSTAP